MMMPLEMWDNSTSYLPYTNAINLYKKRENYIMQVQGKGRITLKPDTAVIYLGILTENKDLEKAQKENAIRTNRVIDVLKDLGISEDSIETLSYDIKKTYDYIDGKKSFRGYEVKNSLKITVTNLEIVGEVIDTAVESGANIVEKIVFTISNPEIYYVKALNLAVENAVKKSLSIGKTLKIRVNRVPIKITEESYAPRLDLEYTPFDGVAATKSTPIQPRELEITAKVQVIFGYQ
ncbi:SIMPL domain-containing protein [Clostridium ganghwense]|uniref:SIMPL domain-containing protein n=1 Tax=Clostridium ganghwense TaxID=312089 RepID=A0ABT4CRV2_9CLOT|nr:SIMPL domain-containing protein [Clostridium ganghwense]MCY6371143.1 SIMPL domain-containing protein [Clostridium ganghwense]